MMDTSDGLMDALSIIANESGVLLDIDFDKIPHDKDLEQFENWQNLVLFGGEDYQIVAADLPRLSFRCCYWRSKRRTGREFKNKWHSRTFTKEDVENKIFNHWENNK